ncbi:N-acetyltransferase [Planomonospora sp. ID67723]|uniref:GNAT family N-acetyltransferase n=1 Tax=Planomonospora sp. ID67723 TaxID=2738134 RepID=UPI0018C3CD8F|nr:GNAT family N-acetyltransferase [Planomonospora sp. ID67723]MBG0832114.1 N-acetyltransferase [Planomonospora sp. ID67723]
MDITVIDVPEQSRYEARLDGARVGLVDYIRTGKTIIFVHTEVDSSAGGKGVGGKLARGVLDGARSEGLSVVPRCPFIKGWIDRHPEYADLVSAHR